jgi:hypothetical protein
MKYVAAAVVAMVFGFLPSKASYMVTLAIKPPYDMALDSDWKDRAILLQDANR